MLKRKRKSLDAPLPMDDDEEGSEGEVWGNEDLPDPRVKRNYSCGHCSFFTQNPRRYLHHLRDEHEPKTKVFECKFCVYASKFSQKIQRHVQLCHGDGAESSEQMDGEEQEDFDGEGSNEGFEEEEEESGPPPLSEEGNGKRPLFRCSTCSYVTNVKARFSKHVKYHSMPNLNCKYCDFKTPYKWNLDRHYKNHNGDGSLRCPLCNFTADIKQSLTVHIQNHHHHDGPVDIEALQQQALLPQHFLFEGMSAAELQAMDTAEYPDGTEEDFVNENPQSERMVQPRRSSTEEPPAPTNGRDFIHPDDILDKNGKIYIKKLKCKLCNFKAVWDTELNRHMSRQHGIVIQRRRTSVGPKAKPMPSLIPIQQQSTSPPAEKTYPPATITAVSSSGLIGDDSSVKEEEGEDDAFRQKSLFLQSLALKPNLVYAMDEEGEEKKCRFCGETCADIVIHLANCPDALRAELEGEAAAEAEAEREKAKEIDEDNDGLVGFETAPGIGSVTFDSFQDEEFDFGANGEFTATAEGDEEDEDLTVTTRRVYRCPQSNCGFWATTASRFHVHVVGHQNVKPFECSVCSYKSNWRWDITKHIKLKGIRDTEHHSARILLTHESGQRNYRKYDKFLVTMQLRHSADLNKLPECSTVASRRNLEMELSPNSQPVVDDLPDIPNGKIRMPKLTRAPLMGNSSPTSSSHSGEDQRPPPPPTLKPFMTKGPGAAGKPFVEKRMLSGGLVLEDNKKEDGKRLKGNGNVGLKKRGIQIPENPSGSDDDRKVQWKCKKCTFKHATKEIVLFHIRQYHKPKRGESVSILNRNNLTSVSVSNDEEAEEPRDDQVQNNMMDDKDDPNNANVKVETHQYTYREEENKFNCKFCPFNTNIPGTMEAHAENHFSKPNCNFSCGFCSFSVPTKKELQHHVQLHVVEMSQGESQVKVREPASSPAKQAKGEGRKKGGSSPYKKYHCSDCPYVTDSKGQFLYHKQFHRPRDAPFKCGKCSYNVSHKHLLHQHWRVHGMEPPPARKPRPKATINNVQPGPSHSNHPTVLVWRNGCPLRMYRCTHCPQVYNKLEDLEEHELGHGQSQNESLPAHFMAQPESPPPSPPKMTPGGKCLYFCEACPARFVYEKELEIHSTFHKKQSPYRCQLCSYSARQENPHLLSHMKVHGIEYQMKTQELLQRYPRAPPPGTSKEIDGGNGSPGNLDLLRRELLKGSSYQISCSKCSAKFSGTKSYEQHMATAHGSLGPYPMDNGFGKMEEEGEKDEAILGNPDFNYPTYIKNGRIKSKRYKCQKCPSAFEKRDQYTVHMGLHGSNQRYKCNICDYAVTYYANFIQHVRKHANQPDVDPEMLIVKPLSSRGSRIPSSMSGQAHAPKEQVKCRKCPYKTADKRAYDNHCNHHLPSARFARNSVMCSYCDFSTSRNHIKEHTRLHFLLSETDPKPDSYMVLDKVNIYVEDEKIYSEKENYDDELDEEEEDEKTEKKKITYVDIQTGLPVNIDSLHPDVDNEMV